MHRLWPVKPDDAYAGYDGTGERLKCSMLRARPETDEPKDAQAGAQVSQTERAFATTKNTGRIRATESPDADASLASPHPPVSEPHVFDLASEADELNQRAIAAKALRNQKKHPKSPRFPRAEVVTLLKACCSCNSNRFKSASSALQGPSKGIVGRPGLKTSRD